MHFALQALVVSIRTVRGNRLIARLNAPPTREQDILDSFPLFRFVLLITIFSLFQANRALVVKLLRTSPNTCPSGVKTMPSISNPILKPQLSTENSILQQYSPPLTHGFIRLRRQIPDILVNPDGTMVEPANWGDAEEQ